MTRARLTQATIRRGAVALAAVLLVLSAAFLGYNHHRGSRYAEAVRLAEAGDTTAASEIFTGLAGYSDAKERAAGLVEKDPALPYRKAAKGDLVTFGSFEQDGDELNGPEPIQWIVLERFGDRLLVLSGDFFDAAFTPAQQGIIPSVLNDNADQSITGAAGGAPTQDRVFALSEQESVIYLSTSAARSDIGAAPASQAAASGTLSVSEEGTADWWLRSPGTYPFAAQYVDAAGTPLPSGANVDVLYGVRPALWIDCAEVGGGGQ